jgi:hypothetical protein
MNPSTARPIKTKDRDTIIQALAAGVVPRMGLPHIQVGRAAEITALVRDIERISDGGAGVRFIIGEYGAGKVLRELDPSHRVLDGVCHDPWISRRIDASTPAGGQARAVLGAIHNMANRRNGWRRWWGNQRLVTDSVKGGRSAAFRRTVIDQARPIQGIRRWIRFAVVLNLLAWREIRRNAENRPWWLRESSTRPEARRAQGADHHPARQRLDSPESLAVAAAEGSRLRWLARDI